MMTNCPICRAHLGGADTCRRCRAELAAVRDVERRGRELAGEAMRRLASGGDADALRLLRRALVGHATPEVRWLAAGLAAAAAAGTGRSEVDGSAVER
jgi:hypothetical protein